MRHVLGRRRPPLPPPYGHRAFPRAPLAHPSRRSRPAHRCHLCLSKGWWTRRRGPEAALSGLAGNRIVGELCVTFLTSKPFGWANTPNGSPPETMRSERARENLFF